jgi:hypothetical protein
MNDNENELTRRPTSEAEDWPLEERMQTARDCFHTYLEPGFSHSDEMLPELDVYPFMRELSLVCTGNAIEVVANGCDLDLATSLKLCREEYIDRLVLRTEAHGCPTEVFPSFGRAPTDSHKRAYTEAHVTRAMEYAMVAEEEREQMEKEEPGRGSPRGWCREQAEQIHQERLECERERRCEQYYEDGCPTVGVAGGVQSGNDSVGRTGAGAPAVATVQGSRLATVTLDQVKPEPVEFEIPDLIPLGKLTLFAGDGGFGKSTITLDWAACITTGRPCCGLDYVPKPAGEVLLVSCEDDDADTIVPRLLAAGADLSRCHTVKGVVGEQGERSLFSLADVAAMGEELRLRPGVRLVVIDPVTAFVGRAGTNDHKDSEIRALLAPLAELATSARVAIVLVAHLNKSQQTRAVARVLGSVGYVNAVRSALFVAADPNNAERRLLLPGKANLTACRQGLAYRTIPLTPEEQANALRGHDGHLSEENRNRLAAQLYRVKWLGKVLTSADDALQAAHKERDPNKVQRCMEWLRNFLGEFAFPSQEIEVAAKKDGFTFDNLKNAKAQLRSDGLHNTNEGRFQGAWWSGFGKPDTWELRPEGGRTS